MSTLRNTSESARTDAPRTGARLATVVGTTALLAATATATAHAAPGTSTSGSSLSARAGGTPAAAERAVGQDLASAAPQTYTVQAGDRLSGIAKRFGLSWQQLCEQNGLRDCNYIVPGQELDLRGGGGGGGGDEARTQDRASRSGGRSGVSLPAVAACIREKESGGNYQAENPATSASGAYQFVDSTWTSVTGLAPPASDYSKATQDRAFMELWDGGAGAHHWVTAEECGA